MKNEYFVDTYHYFSKLNPEINNGFLLDYGCNYGVFLESSNGIFEEKNYTGIDVDADALNYGKNIYPVATFLHYNGYNPIYNPNGIKDFKPILQQKFNTIISYSVLTHTSIEDFIKTIEWLYLNLSQGGKLLISWLDVNDKITKKYFTEKRLKEFGYCDPIKTNSYIYLVDNKISQYIHEGTYLLLFFNIDFLREILKNYKFKLFSSPGGKNCFQSCIVIEK